MGKGDDSGPTQKERKILSQQMLLKKRGRSLANKGEGNPKPSSCTLPEGQNALGAYFGYRGVWMGHSFLSATGPSCLARNHSGQEAQESLEGYSSLPLLDSVV